MSPKLKTVLNATLKTFSAAAICLTLLAVFQSQAKADTLIVNGSSNSQSPIAGSTAVSFVGQAFNNIFNVTANGQTFDFTFGRFSIQPGTGGSTGCLDPGGCEPITLTGLLTAPASALSFSGLYDEVEDLDDRELSVFWMTGVPSIAFTTAEGGSGTFSISLLNFFASNQTGTTQLYDQLARITITQFTPGQTTVVPEPATMLLLGTGLAGLAAKARRRRKSAI